MESKKNIFLWALYDFASSITSVVFFLYFSQWLVAENGVSDFWYNMIFAVGSLFLLLTAPVFGAIADKTGKSKRYLAVVTVFSFLCFLAVSLITLFFPSKVFLAALFFLFANYLYQFSFVFYHSFLRQLAPAEKWGRVSGIGQAGYWLGEIFGVILALPFAAGVIYFFGNHGRAQVFLPATVLFFALALPMLLFFRASSLRGAEPGEATWQSRARARTLDCHAPTALAPRNDGLWQEYKNQWNKFRELISEPNMRMFLLSFFFFNDAVITGLTNFPIILQNLFAFTDFEKSLLILGILITSAAGALISGWFADKIGMRKTLLAVILGWIVIFPVLAVLQGKLVFSVFAILMGFFFGSVWTVTRAVMTALSKKEKLNYGFSFYALTERVSTFFSPLSWGLITYLFLNIGPARYRIAAASMAIFVAIGLYFVLKIDKKVIK